MNRIFPPLAGTTLLSLLATFVVGVVSKFRDGVLHPQDPIYLIHFSLGLFSAVLILLVHCLIFTYFLGTGRWVKEVGLAYDLPDAGLPKTTRELKRIVFPAALFAMLSVIATAAAGAGAQLQEWPWPVHATFAVIALAINVWACRVEYRTLCANGIVLAEVLQEVDRIRAERGLPSNEEALRHDAV